MYPVIAKVEYWDNDNTLKTTNVLLYAETLSDATHQIENLFSNTLDSCCVKYVADSGVYFEVPDSVASIFFKGDGIYSDGLSQEEE